MNDPRKTYFWPLDLFRDFGLYGVPVSGDGIPANARATTDGQTRDTTDGQTRITTG
jgi:hypothetical protein